MLEIKDAPRQEKIKSYKKEAEQAIAKGNYPKAISAIQTATLLAPEDSSLMEWLASIQGDQANAQLRLHQTQADQAEGAGNWEVAIAAREAALKQHPDDQRLIEQLEKTRAAKQQAQIKEIKSRIERAKQESKWEAAILATQEYLQLLPDDQEAKKELALLKVEQHNSKVRNLKTQAEAASKAEKWEEAIQYWQAYLLEKPEDRSKVDQLIEQAKQKAALLRDYETAQVHLKKRQYNRAIHLLQGIIAKDPTYKTSSRLLVEAVEANKQKKPIWQTPWVYAGFGIVLVAVVVIILLPQIKSWVNPSEVPAGVAEVSSTPTVSASPTPTGRTLTVTQANDTKVGSLYYVLAIAQEHDTITFNPTIFPPDNPTTIFLKTELPRITQGHIILDASNAGVIIDGSNLPDETFGLILSSNSNKIMGLQIINCPGIGIYVEGWSHNQIGGDRNQGVGPVGQGNLISNNGTGINLLSNGGGNVITGNLIGTELDGYTPMGNIGPGISIEKNETISPIPNTIGPDNFIAYNNIEGGGPGIELMSGFLSTHITQNLIFENGGKGISYFENDAAVEPPVIIYHDLEEGVVSGQSCSGCEVEIFSTYQNEGEIFEGSVKADDFGNFVFYKGEALAGPNLTAVAISSNDKTSEFSDPPSPNSAMRAARDFIQTEPPDYESSFDVWEFGEPGGNIYLENGTIIIDSEWANIAQGISDLVSDKFVVQYDYLIDASGNDGTCFFGQNNEDINRGFAVGHHLDGTTSNEHYEHPNQYPRYADGNHDFYSDQPNQVLIIGVEDLISVFVNNRLIYSYLDPFGSAVYNRQTMHAEWGATCAFDNYKIWNLEGLEYEPPLPPEAFTQEEFYPQILRYISEAPPTFEDNFSTVKEEWGNVVVGSEEVPLVEFQDDGKLIFNFGNEGGEERINFPTNGMLNAENFILVFDFYPQGITDEQSTFGFQFRADEINDSFYDIKIYEGRWNIEQKQDNKVTSLNNGIIGSYVNSKNFMLIVNDDQMALFVDGNRITTMDINLEGSSNNFHISRVFHHNEIDNIQFWNLDGVEFEKSDAIDVDKAVMEEQLVITNNFINETQPTFEDDFSTVKPEWGDIQKNNQVYPLRNNIINEKLTLSIPAGVDNYTVPTNGLLNANEFIVAFDFEWLKRHFEQERVQFGFKFLHSDTNGSEYDLRFVANGNWEISANKVGGNQYSVLDSGTYGTTGIIQVLLSVYDQSNIFLVINNTPVAFIQGITDAGNSNYFYFSASDGLAEINIDNVQFWNLNGVESLQ